MTHFTQDDAARWVAGVLDDTDAEALEAHARSCAGCERLLRVEAQADAQLSRLVQQLPRPGVRVTLRRVMTVAVPLALAASLTLVLAQLFSASVDSVDDAGFAAAHSAPVYERGAEIPPEALTANEPFPL